MKKGASLITLFVPTFTSTSCAADAGLARPAAASRNERIAPTVGCLTRNISPPDRLLAAHILGFALLDEGVDAFAIVFAVAQLLVGMPFDFEPGRKAAFLGKIEHALERCERNRRQ